jgi:hypothetical protein
MKSLLMILFLLTGISPGQTIAPEGKYFLMLGFNEPMDTNSLKHKENYEVFDQDFNIIPVLNVAIGYDEETGVCEDTLVVLLINAPSYKTTYAVRVSNVKDRAGNLIHPGHNSAWYYFDGYDPVNEKQPYLIVK